MKRDELPAEMVQVQRPSIPAAEQPTVEVTAAQITLPPEVVSLPSNPSPTDQQAENERLRGTVGELTDLLTAQSELISEVTEEETPAGRTRNAAEIKPVGEEKPPTVATPVASDAPPPKPPEPPMNPAQEKSKSVLRNFLFG